MREFLFLLRRYSVFMKIYIDFDDVLCETARKFVDIAHRLFGIDLPYEKVRFFDLQKSFGLTDGQYEKLMAEGHLPEVLLSYEETPGASDTVNAWIDAGHEVFVITGRPYSAYGPSRQWLDEHGLERTELFCLNKYGRDAFIKNSEFSLELDDFYKMHFDFAVEDSPAAFKHLAHLKQCTVAVFARPWNESAELPAQNYIRCAGWQEIDNLLGKS